MDGYEYTGQVTIDAPEEADRLLSAFQKKARKENLRQSFVGDAEFYSCVIFQTVEQRDAFIAALEAVGMQPPEDPQYLNGEEIADVLEIEIPASEYGYRPTPISPILRFFAMA